MEKIKIWHEGFVEGGEGFINHKSLRGKTSMSGTKQGLAWKEWFLSIQKL